MKGPRGMRAVAVFAALGVLLAGIAAACGAPASQQATGPVADAVRASMDSGTATFAHDRWDGLLAGGTERGLVDYRYFQEHRDRLDAYLERVAEADLAGLAPSHLEALLINAYNAYTVEAILEHPEVASIRDIDGVWSETTRTVGGYELTLDEIEHNVLRPFFRDPRVHFAVNCASLSCAPLPTWAFTGDSLDAQMERRTRAFLRDTANVRVDGGTLVLSRYFDWYGGDFTEEGWSPRAETIPRFVARYGRPEVRELVEEAGGDPPVRFTEYDWSLNATPGGEPRAAADAPAKDALHASLVSLLGPGTDGAAVRQADEPPSGSGWVASLRDWVDGFGVAGPVVYGLVYVLATVLLVPGSALTIGAGVAFGLLWGTVLVSLASVAGAAAAFLIARYVAREKVAGWVTGREKFEAVDRAVGKEGWKVVALTRLSPVFPFNFLNYAFGLTRVRLGPYVLASWLAMLPGTLMYVYIGAAGTTVAAAATGAADWGQTLLQVAGLLATIAVVVLVTRRARQVLREAAGEGAEALDAATE
ncbi:MAG: VTT domain-containing protein [Candidatus Palauibacterales bacterium]|nr:VTT domain-containing protein [Candidatus Palauibacterales bacterium]